jgi:peroxiredoxin
MSDTSNTESLRSSLAQQSQETVQEFMSRLPEQTRQTVMLSFERLLASDVGDNAKAVGDVAPLFCLPSARGGELCLSELLAAGPVVLSFYRGGWCPFCDLEFKALHDWLPEIQALGAAVVGVSPETLDTAVRTLDQHAIEFEVLSDVGNKVAQEYGLVMTVDEALRPHYREWGIDLPAANGDESYALPLPATYVIDTAGVIRAAYVNKDYTQRMEPSDVVQALKSLGR